jgi:hypothetical protein
MKHFTIVAAWVLAFAIATPPLAVHAQTKKASGKTMNTSGTVKSVSGTSLVVSAGGKDMTFTVDPTTKITGKGLGTKAKAAGGKVQVTDAVHDGDTVRVAYHDMDGTMHAATVTVKSSKTK